MSYLNYETLVQSCARKVLINVCWHRFWSLHIPTSLYSYIPLEVGLRTKLL